MTHHARVMLGRLVSTAASLAAVLTAVVVVGWIVYSHLTGATLITFRTGSMTPAMPQGAMAITVPVAASDIQVGDVVTVPRLSDGRPVTHRVVSVSEPADLTVPGARELVLKGDANTAVDHRPYVVTEARRVVFSLAGVGAAMETLRSPSGFAGLTVLLACLVTWAFWPSERDSRPAPRRLHPVPRHAAARAR